MGTLQQTPPKLMKAQLETDCKRKIYLLHFDYAYINKLVSACKQMIFMQERNLYWKVVVMLLLQNVKIYNQFDSVMQQCPTLSIPWTAAGQASFPSPIYIILLYVHTIYIAYYILHIYLYMQIIIGIAKIYFSTCVIYFKAIAKCRRT